MKKITTQRKLHVLIWAVVSLLLLSTGAIAQTRTISGTVTGDPDSQPVPGVSVRVKGANTGVSTDIDGKFTISAKTGDILVISSIGYVSQEIRLAGQSQLTVSLASTSTYLEEAVVIGYGVQKKKLLTGANLQVKGDDLQKQSSTNALQALQGQAPGVQITPTSGQPGSGINVIIRGKGTVGNSSPLYVVDGVIAGDISYINPADIESIDVLKDAASAAIYGSQSANGVVLITTRTGKSGQKAQITFDGYGGLQRVADKASLLNSEQYASIMNEAAVNSGKMPYFTNSGIAAMGKGTNWLDEMFVNDARTQNYSFAAQGAGAGSVFSTSLSYTDQEGIVGGSDLSNYERYNFRVNTEHNLYKDMIKLGQHLTFSYIKNNGIGVGNQYNNSLRSAFNTSPFVPMYDEAGNFFNNVNSDWNNGEANPYAQMVYSNQNRNNNQRLFGDVYISIEPVKGLRFRSSLGLDYNTYEGRSFSPIYELSSYAFNNNTKVSQSIGKGKNIQWDNMLSYRFDVNNFHSFEVMGGTSSIANDGSGMDGSNRDLVFADLEHAWLKNATNKDGSVLSLNGSPYESRLLSYFGRIQYNFKETYLFNATFRADGSSKFDHGNRWGYFPSVSAGWVMTNEPFLKNISAALSFLKLRASWGQVGNQNIAGYQFLTPVSFSYTNYSFGTEEGILTPGAFPSRLGNPNVKWETSVQTNAGVDASFLRSRLNLSFDYYIKDTKDWLLTAPVLATSGADAPVINGGDVRNSGVELALSYNSNKRKFGYTVGVNGAVNKNKVGKIPTADGTIHGMTNQLYNNSLEFWRAQNGFPIGYFWGLKTNGIFQTEAEVADNRSAAGKVIQPTAAPGDVRYADLNKDGIISDLDRTIIGDPNPNLTFGFNFSANYKGFDLYLLASGVACNQLVQSYRNQADAKANYSLAILDRWHGPGSSNTTPRVTEDNRNWTQFSDLYIHDGDFLRLSNVTIGYDLSRVLKKRYLSKVRLYASALNLYTFTKYSGMDPEVGFGESFSSGIDLGYYPRPRIIMIGTNIRF